MKRVGSRVTEADESYQVDAIVSLFAIMLVLLLAMVTATSSSTNDERTAYLPQDPVGEIMSLRSLQVPYRLRELWILQDNGLMMHINTTAIAEQFEGVAPGPGPERTLDGVDFSFEPHQTQPGSYRMKIAIWDTDLAGWATLGIVDTRDPEALTAWAGSSQSTLVFVTNQAKALIAPVAQALQTGKRRGRLFVPRSDTRYVTLVRAADRFSLEGIYRAD